MPARHSRSRRRSSCVACSPVRAPSRPSRHGDAEDRRREGYLDYRLQRSLATTNAAESLLSRTRHVKRNVKRWRGGQMMLRWVATGVLEAVKGFRRLKGCGDMPRLVSALRALDQRLRLGVSEVNVA